ncbi:MAG: hypothetical protein AAF907_14875 [Planctomycetota bacterium]
MPDHCPAADARRSVGCRPLLLAVGAAVLAGGCEDGEPAPQTPAVASALDAADPQTLLPATLPGWRRVALDREARNMAFNLTRDGVHALYIPADGDRTEGEEDDEAAGPGAVELFLYAPEPDSAAFLAGVRERLSDRDRFGDVQFAEPDLGADGLTLQFDMAPVEGVPELHGVMVDRPDRFLFARGPSGDVLKSFLSAYLAAQN